MSTSTGRDGTWLSQRMPTRDDLPGLLVVPNIAWYGLFMAFPLVYLVFLSFTDANGAEDLLRGTYTFIGFDNYAGLLSDRQFWNSFLVTWLFVFTSLALKIILGVSLAMLLTHQWVRGKRYMRALAIIPLGLPPIFMITLWRSIFSGARFGVANEVYITIAGLVVENPTPIGWFANRWLAFMTYVLTEVWMAYPFVLIIVVSALQGVDKELHDAAKVDGAGFFNRFYHVTLPQIKRPVWFASILTAAASFQQFLIPLIFNDGGPARQNELILFYGYREAFQAPPNMGEGAAIMVIALIFIGMFMWLNVKKGRLAEGINN
ncbi:sugar ABC transporter permease [Natronolimnobius sp. AArcel1]|uniref:carbohydrate ABC transporter permease n=1 Tax=Natronolimnobius sp. AArcel1 TaxID=1679093 RepID=UPI0013EC224B|nr:sugar ABC transporter permease [Natronolimnobius sp. AArcel1]NGM71125.1 sugar ABC transporter permease [Natronolimnobius sp. AArcel1]